MRLLVSVADALEADEALAGGAHIIDAKDPARGPLGAVSAAALAAIRGRVGSARPVSAALGDAVDERRIELEARRCAGTGVAFIKIGFAGITSEAHAAPLLAAARRGTDVSPDCGVVAVAYADADRVGALPPAALIGIAARAGVTGILMDTADKGGPGLLELSDPTTLADWAARARRAGLQVGLAGRLSGADIAALHGMGIDIDVVGVRGAACDGGREGRVVSAKVRALVELVGRRDDDLQSVGPHASEERIHEVAS